MRAVPLVAALRAYVLACWHALSPGWERAGDALELAHAIATVVVEDGDRAPIYGSHALDAAVLAYWAVRESGLRLDARNPTGRSVGAWQGGGGPALAQARRELALLHEGARRCPDAPGAIVWGACHARDVLTGRDVADLARARERRSVELATIALAL